MRYIALLLFCGILAVLPIWGGRTTNGVSDAMQSSSTSTIWNIWPAGQAQGSIAFTLNLTALPTGTNMSEILVWPGSHYQKMDATHGWCSTAIGPCVDIVQFGPTASGALVGLGSDFQIDITEPGGGEANALYPALSTGLHHYALTLNRTATSINFWIDGVLQTPSLTGQTSDPGALTSHGQVTMMAGIGTTGQLVNFTNGTLSDVAVWQNYTLTTNDAIALAKCEPPNRIHPEFIVYWPLDGTDSPEPAYNSFVTSSFLVPSLALTGTTKGSQQAGCPRGGDYAP